MAPSPTYSGNIDTYELSAGTPNTTNNFRSLVTLRGSFGIAYLYFVPEGGQLGTNGKNGSYNLFYVYQWESAWDRIVDMLRNEDSTKFSYYTQNNTAFVHTGAEPVGEEES